MTPEDILAIASRPEVPKFLFGSPELDEWTRKHRDAYTGVAKQDSGFYVVHHRGLQPQQPDFQVLSWWIWGQTTPLSWDVPAQLH